MTSSERLAIEELVRCSRSLFDRGYCCATAGNVSVRVEGKVFVTPTNSSLGTLTATEIATVDLAGNVMGDRLPSKETPFHLAIYRSRPEMAAVVHTHSTYITAVACLRDLNMDDALPIFVPYYAMRVARLPVVPYFPPGDLRLASEVGSRITVSPAVLLRNHGLITTGGTVAEAAALVEEIEEAAKLFFLLGDRGAPLSPEQVAELRRRYG